MVVMLIILLMDFVFSCNFGMKAEFCGYFSILSTFPISLSLFEFYDRYAGLFWPVHVIISLLYYFFVGLIVGWLYGKIRNKNKIAA